MPTYVRTYFFVTHHVETVKRFFFVFVCRFQDYYYSYYYHYCYYCFSRTQRAAKYEEDLTLGGSAKALLPKALLTKALANHVGRKRISDEVKSSQIKTKGK